MSEKIPPGLVAIAVEWEEYESAVMGVKLELSSGFLIYPERREALFLALLKNIGLLRAVELVGRERWEEALREAR